MTAKDDVITIRKNLLKEFGLDLGEWYSDGELIGGNSFTYDETLWFIKRQVDSLLERHPDEVQGRIGFDATERLRTKFLKAEPAYP